MQMGFITNQWLNSETWLSKGHRPVEGEVSYKVSSGDWSERNNVVFEIQVEGSDERTDGKYQEVYLTQDEVDSLLPQIIEVGERSIRLRVAHAILANLTDAELLQFMTDLLSERTKATASVNRSEGVTAHA